MKILSIFLKGYKPLALSNIDSITIDFNNPVVLILGLNGCGKSSLLRESTPFPANASDYRDGGIKEIVIEHNGHIYILISMIKKNNSKHTFIKDGIEIHSLSITSIHKELVYKEFGYTPIIHRLLIGDLLFTSMLPANRREILTQISPLELDYAISLYAKTKEHIRDTTAVLKHIINKRSDVEHKLLLLDIPSTIEKDKLVLELQADKFTPYTLRKEVHPSVIYSNIDSLYTQLEAARAQLRTYKDIRLPKHISASNMNELYQVIGEITGAINNTQKKINSIAQQILSLQNITIGITDKQLKREDVKRRISLIQTELSIMMYFDIPMIDYSKCIIEFNSLHNSLDILFNNIDDIIIYSDINIASIKERYEVVRVQLSSLQNREALLKKDIEHYLNPVNITTCPKCNFDFTIKGIDVATNLKRCQEESQQLVNTIKILTAEHDILYIKNSDISKYLSAVERIRQLRLTSEVPISFWDTLISSRDIISNPTKILNLIIKWINNIKVLAHKSELELELSQYTKLDNIYSEYGDDLDDRTNNLQEEINTFLVEKYELEKSLNVCNKVVKNINTYTAHVERASELQAKVDIEFDNLIKSVIYTNARTELDSIYAQLTEIKNAVESKNRLQQSLDELIIEQTTLQLSLKAGVLLEEQLSPTKGLIAEQMLGFIKSYLNEINIICAEIWGYDLEVVPCNLDDGVLDYIFPTLIDGELQAPDISKGSLSQKDVINLAFMIVMRQYLGITNFPLYLDETGAHFDKVHRGKLMQYIRTVVNNGICSQLFIVNHFSNIYGELVNHDTVVIDDRNIDVPKNYNEHVTITYME